MKPSIEAVRRFVSFAAIAAAANPGSEAADAVATQRLHNDSTTSTRRSIAHVVASNHNRKEDRRTRLQKKTLAQDKELKNEITTTTTTTTTTRSDVTKNHRPLEKCQPDLGILACTKPDEWCVRAQAMEDNYSETTMEEYYWYCLPNETDSDPTTTKMTSMVIGTPTLQQQRRRHLWQHRFLQAPDSFGDMPFEGGNEIYNYCYETFTYDPSSMPPDDPSSYDVCVCYGYDFNLPEDTYAYSCAEPDKLVVNYCKKYFYDEDTTGTERLRKLTYDVCVCTLSKDGTHPSEPDKDFCDGVPMSYCQYKFPNLAETQKCLCQIFLLPQFCPNNGDIPSPTPQVNLPSPTALAPVESPQAIPVESPQAIPVESPQAMPVESPQAAPIPVPTPAVNNEDLNGLAFDSVNIRAPTTAGASSSVAAISVLSVAVSIAAALVLEHW